VVTTIKKYRPSNINALLSLFILLILTASNVMAAPVASIDRSVIAKDDSFIFSIRIYDGNVSGSPDLEPLNNNFYILSNNKSSNYFNDNGNARSLTEWQITLMPKRIGQLTVPAINVGNDKTQALTINVQPSVPISEGTLRPIYLESEVSTDTSYPQQQVIYTLRIFYSIQLDNMSLSELKFDNAIVEQLDQQTFQRRIQNTPYRVHELRYAIFPQETGELTIPAMVFSANEALARRSVFNIPGQGQAIRKMSKQHTIDVIDMPANYGNNTWLPANAVALEESWSSDPDKIRVGDSITRTITLRADGLLGSQLPPYTFEPVNNAKFYPDQGQTESTTEPTGVKSIRVDSTAIIPTTEGPITLPPIRVKWWNTEQDRMEETVIAERTLTALPALANTQSNSQPLAIDHSGKVTPTNITTPIAQQATPSVILWQSIAVLFAALWAITLWLFMKKKTVNTTVTTPAAAKKATNNEKQLFKQLSKLCHDNNHTAVRSALVEWANAFWPEAHIQCLQDIARHAQQQSLTTALLQLDDLLYGSQQHTDQWNGENLLATLKQLRQQKESNSTEEQLSPLYPQ
jgi:hypothetical protein